MSNEKRVIIFCQSSGDIIHSIALYQKYENVASISIYCINTIYIYKYLLKLNLKLERLEFIPYDINISLKNPLSVIRARNKLSRLYKKYFIKNKNDEVYFFSVWFDWITFFFVNNLSKKNNVTYYKHYNGVTENGKNKYNLREKYELILYYLATCIRFNYTEEENYKRLLFQYNYVNIKKQSALKVQPEILKKYLYKVNNSNDKSILLFEARLSSHKIYTNYLSEMKTIIKALQGDGYNIYIKGHPRIGVSKELEEICDFSIPNFIPAELIDINQFQMFIGIDSFSLVYIANYSDFVFSLIELLSFNDENEKKRFLNYLNENSNKQIHFPIKVSEICISNQ